MLIPTAPSVSEMADSSAVIPEASYNLRVSKSEYVAIPKSKDAKGPYIKVQLIVTGPGDNEYVGRIVFQNYSLTGDGSFRLRELLTITGHPDDFRLTDSDQLLGLEFGAAITTQKGTGGWSDRSQVAKHLPLLTALVAFALTAKFIV